MAVASVPPHPFVRVAKMDIFSTKARVSKHVQQHPHQMRRPTHVMVCSPVVSPLMYQGNTGCRILQGFESAQLRKYVPHLYPFAPNTNPFMGYWGRIDINECAQEPSPCKNGGVCTDVIDSFSCSCKDTEFIGPTCAVPKHCNPNPCKNGGMYVELCVCLFFLE